MARYLRLIPIFNFVFQFRYNRENFSNESRKSQARDDRSGGEKVIVKDGKTSSDGTIHVPSNVSISKGNRPFASLSLSLKTTGQSRSPTDFPDFPKFITQKGVKRRYFHSNSDPCNDPLTPFHETVKNYWLHKYLTVYLVSSVSGEKHAHY